jgi:ribosomal protein S18 acetylase RimI-like enzyme
VLNFVDEDANREYNRKRGWTEEITTRRAYRRRGLASSLIVQSIRMFREMGFEETALGVDTENLSGALSLYESIGYQVSNSTTTYRKPMD